MLNQYEMAGQLTIPRLLLDHYRHLNINHEELVLILHLKSRMDQGNAFPKLQDIANAMGLDKNEVYKLIHQLIQKGLLKLVQDKDHEDQARDYFSLQPLWKRLEDRLEAQDFQYDLNETKEKEKQLFKRFEEEFGRPLTPMEIETIGQWVQTDHYAIELIELALREAVLNQAFSFKYIDRILLNWERKNIKTPQQVQAAKEKFEERQSQSTRFKRPQIKRKVPIYNWMDDDRPQNSK